MTISVVPEPDDKASVQWKEQMAYPGKIDSYRDSWASIIWAMWRNSRIFVAAIVVRACLWLTNQAIDATEGIERVSSYPEFFAARHVLQAMVDDTCASVPLRIHHIENGDSNLEGVELIHKDFEQTTTATDEVIFPPPCDDYLDTAQPTGFDILRRPLGGYHLMWPLFVASGVITVSRHQRSWIRGRLVYIGARFGVQQADALGTLHERLGESGRPVFAQGAPKRQSSLNGGVQNGWGFLGPSEVAFNQDDERVWAGMNMNQS